MEGKKKKKSFKSEVSSKIDATKCRICGKEDGVIPIFDNPSRAKIPQDIKKISGVVVSETDKLPKSMCRVCLDLLNGCISFRTMCRKTNRRMLKIIVKTERLEWAAAAAGDGVGGGGGAACSSSSASSCEGGGGGRGRGLGLPTFSDAEESWGCTKCGGHYTHMKAYNKHLPRCSVRSPGPPTATAPRAPLVTRRTPLRPYSPAGSWAGGGGGAGDSGDPPVKVKMEEVTKRKFLCDVCGKTAFSNAGLLIHKGIHSDVFPWACDTAGCEYRGRTLDLLKVHRRSHLTTDQKPYKCAHCPKACSTTSNLNKHVRHVHSTHKPHKGGGFVFQCAYCEKAFSYQHDMKRHVRDIHLRQGTVECDVCYKKFNTKKILQGHRWKIHKIKGERHGRLPAYLLVQAERAQRAPAPAPAPYSEPPPGGAGTGGAPAY